MNDLASLGAHGAAARSLLAVLFTGFLLYWLLKNQWLDKRGLQRVLDANRFANPTLKHIEQLLNEIGKESREYTFVP